MIFANIEGEAFYDTFGSDQTHEKFVIDIQATFYIKNRQIFSMEEYTLYIIHNDHANFVIVVVGQPHRRRNVKKLNSFFLPNATLEADRARADLTSQWPNLHLLYWLVIIHTENQPILSRMWLKCFGSDQTWIYLSKNPPHFYIFKHSMYV